MFEMLCHDVPSIFARKQDIKTLDMIPTGQTKRVCPAQNAINKLPKAVRQSGYCCISVTTQYEQTCFTKTSRNSFITELSVEQLQHKHFILAIQVE